MGPFVSVLLDLLICCFFSGFMFLCFVYVFVYIGQSCTVTMMLVFLCFVYVVVYIRQCYTVTMMLVQWVPCHFLSVAAAAPTTNHHQQTT